MLMGQTLMQWGQGCRQQRGCSALRRRGGGGVVEEEYQEASEEIEAAAGGPRVLYTQQRVQPAGWPHLSSPTMSWVLWLERLTNRYVTAAAGVSAADPDAAWTRQLLEESDDEQTSLQQQQEQDLKQHSKVVPEVQQQELPQQASNTVLLKDELAAKPVKRRFGFRFRS